MTDPAPPRSRITTCVSINEEYVDGPCCSSVLVSTPPSDLLVSRERHSLQPVCIASRIQHTVTYREPFLVNAPLQERCPSVDAVPQRGIPTATPPSPDRLEGVYYTIGKLALPSIDDLPENQSAEVGLNA
ncbi:unnamed protein product [Peronospora destructor]|uniref:Uncharacterized protein n=1 Tax=Peronospora destructor TaxID=86335 RepID=A0AAV0T3I0_9STRA|nr:unnamed protein product [Peronospora destructor]